MGRKILFITTDQQRYDGLACNGGKGPSTAGPDGGTPGQGWQQREGQDGGRAHGVGVVAP